jgi:pilus assembly protein CpaB
MRLRISIMLPAAVILGVSAVQAGRIWLDRQMDDRLRMMAPAPNAVEFGTLVVAAASLRYGAEITASNVKEIPWPQQQTPAGSFARVSELFEGNAKRVALSAMEANEPVLLSKVSGPNQRANMAAMIEPGMKAITVRVDDVVGVAGFVLPGDRVDVLLTRQSAKSDAFSDTILQNIKVLAVDQMVDDKALKPTVARAITLQASTEQAQRLIVAQSVGTLTLVLRPLGQAAQEPTQQVTSMDLTREPRQASPALAADSDTAALPSSSSVTVSVIRSMVRKEYNVPAGIER